MIFVGVIEYEGNRTTYNIVKNILILSDYKISYESKTKNIAFCSCKEINIALMNITFSSIELLKELGVEFHILIHTFLNEIEVQDETLVGFLKTSKYLVLNCDDKKWSLLLKNINSLVITYGFNTKATVTLSSYSSNEPIKGNICTQREIISIDGNIVEPFEFPIEISRKEKNYIYYVLASVACGLILGNNILTRNLPIEIKL